MADKPHPVSKETSKDISAKKRVLEEFVETITHKTDEDLTNREAHMSKLSHWVARRYQTLGKDPQWPWPGSSNWRSPVVDAEISKAKGPLMSVFNSDPIVSFIPMSTDGFDKTDAAEQTMQWLLKSRMRDFEDSAEILADQLKTYGYSIAKINYEYKTQIISELVRRSEIEPQVIAESRAAAAQVGQQRQDGSVVTDEEAGQIIVEYLSQEFGLDTDDEVDAQAVIDLTDFIVNSEEDEIQIKRREIFHDAPHVSAVDPTMFIIETGVTDLQSAERLTEIMFKTSNDLLTSARDGYYNKKAVERILKQATENDLGEVEGDGNKQFTDLLNSQFEQQRADREGLTLTDKTDLFRIHHTYTLYDIDGDGIKEKVLLIYHHGTGEVLRFMEFPFEHGCWPFVQLRNEDADGRFYSPRGIPEMINQIDELITENRRGKINYNRIALAPTIKFRLGSGINPNNFKHTPGQAIPVSNMNDFEFVQTPNRDFSFDNEEQTLQFWVERVLGSTDLALQSKGGSEARTRAEIQAVSGIGQQSTTMSVKRWQRGWKRIYEQIWALWMQYGPRDFVISQSLGQIKPISRHQIQGKFDMVPVGTADEVNPDLKFARAQQRMQLVMGLLSQGVNLQEFLGDEFEFSFRDLFIDMMQKDDFVMAQKVIRRRSPEEIQRIQAQRQQQQAQAQQQQAVQDNQPTSLADLSANLKQMKKDSPNGGAQQVAF